MISLLTVVSTPKRQTDKEYIQETSAVAPAPPEDTTYHKLNRSDSSKPVSESQVHAPHPVGH